MQKRLLTLVFILLVIPALLYSQDGGDALFTSKCATCHGKDGAGKTPYAQRVPVPNLGAAAVQSMSDRELYDSIARGTHHKEYPHAFALRGMTEGEINSLVRKIRDFGKK